MLCDDEKKEEKKNPQTLFKVFLKLCLAFFFPEHLEPEERLTF